MLRGKPQSNEKGQRGVGSLVKLSANKVRMDFDAAEPVGLEVSETTIPEILLKVINKMPDNAKVSIECTLDITGTKIMFARPLVGTFDFKLIKFYAPEGQQPVMETKVGKGGKAYRQFSAIVEILRKTGAKSDLWKGARYNIFFFDSFGKNEKGDLLVLSKGEASDFLSDFLDATGVGTHTIPYSENPLPAIERIALEEEVVFSASVKGVVNKKGETYANVVMFNYTPAESWTDEEAVDESFPKSETVHSALRDEDLVF